jgi:tripartite-type tricarboxylate transporter receptor subunit TctC
MRVFRGVLTALALVAGAALAQAQGAWPTKPVKIVVPFAPGGTSDFIARLIANPLGEALGQQVIVENKPGNAGNLGAGLVAVATDNHTVMLSDISSLAISPLITNDLPFKLKDLQGVTMLGYSPHLLAVHPSVQATTLAELVTLSKTKPVNVASAGSGSPNHLGVVEMAQKLGLRWTHIPYKGGAQALTDMIAGTADVILNGMVATAPHVQSGKLKLIGISSPKRSPAYPNAMTIAEQGVAGYESGTYQGVTAPATMPKEAVAKLGEALKKVMAAPDIVKRMNEAGADVMTNTPAELTAFIAKEEARWSGVVKAAGTAIEGTK